jgi:predicted deacetylase
MAIFAREGVRPDIWVAPAHSFDGKTLQALAECGLTTVSDGYSALPHTDARGMFWIPQQLGRMRELPAGVWTVCHHHNHWSPEELLRLRSDLARYRGRYSTRSEQWMDRMSAGLMGMARKARFGAAL